MDIATGFGLILSLLQFYLRSKDKREAADAQDFYNWLIEHKFQEVKDCITRNFTLMSEVEKLLHENQDVLLQRFDDVDEKLLMILHSVEEFREITEKISPEACLSKRQQKLLWCLVHSGSEVFYVHKIVTGAARLEFGNITNPNAVKGLDDKFLCTNIEILCQNDFLQFDGKRYYLTEAGQDYIDNLDKKSEQEI